ncbi:MAG: ribonuclease Y [Acidobacteria bacterium]|nr:ribonuclease Y [Acidobacteriota bacterium]
MLSSWLAGVSDSALLACLAALLLGLAGGVLLGWLLALRKGQGVLAQARDKAASILESARSSAEEQTRTMVALAEQELQLRRQALEDEEQRRRHVVEEAEAEAERRHRRLVDRDRALTRRDQLVREREMEVDRRRQDLIDEREKVVRLEEQVVLRLEEVAGLTRDEAKRQLMDSIRLEARQNAAAEVRAIKEDAQRQADTEAQKIMALAIERLASDFASERTVSTVPLPDPTFRGRIIGAEGRNIRTFEKVTGMQLVLDDDPGHVVISGFNPIRREIARRSLERLIEGGTVHPRKILQTVSTTRRKVESEILKAGEEAVEQFRLRGIHPELVSLLGRLRYRTSYGQNVLEHVIEAATICGIMAAELGLDQKLAQRAALLHDIGKAVDFEREGTHPEIGAELARRYGEPPVVVNAIESHHDDTEVTDPISVLVAAADALSGARPGARRRTTADYLRRVAQLEQLASSFDGVDNCYALQAGREIRVIVEPKKITDDAAAMLALDLSQRIQSEMDFPGRIKVTVIREVRAQAVAR